VRTAAGPAGALVNPVRLRIIDLIDNRTCAISKLLRRVGSLRSESLTASCGAGGCRHSWHPSRWEADSLLSFHCQGKKVCELMFDVLRAQVKNGQRVGVCCVPGILFSFAILGLQCVVAFPVVRPELASIRRIRNRDLDLVPFSVCRCMRSVSKHVLAPKFTAKKSALFRELC